jgi:putative RNA 2'-phosphotransferase
MLFPQTASASAPTRATAPKASGCASVTASLEAILREGLRRMQRHHVHLSPDVGMAAKVGARRGEPVVLAADARAMRADGCVFFRSANGVWLTEAVPTRYLSLDHEREAR